MTTPAKTSSSKTSSSKTSSSKTSSSIKKSATAATTTQTQPPWTSKNRKTGNHDHADADDDGPAHSLPLPEEARTTAAVAVAVANAANNNGKTSSTIMSKRRIMIIVGTVLAVVLIVSLSIAIAAKKRDEGASSSVASSSKKVRGSDVDVGGAATSFSGVRDPDLDVGQNERLRNMVNFLAVYSQMQDLETLDSPQNKAVKWMSDTDTAAMPIPPTTHYKDAFAFVQRYILAVLFYSTNGPHWKHDVGFMSSTSVCEWNAQREITITDMTTGEAMLVSQKVMRSVGVDCDDYGQVNYIYLRTL
jgi:hypothetical protein